MVDLSSNYALLVGGLALLSGVVLFLLVAPRIAWPVLLAGSIQVLHAPAVVHFNGEYWSPYRLGDFPFGIEDVIVSFALGAGVWIAASHPWRGRIKFELEFATIVWRLLVISVPATLAAIIVSSAGLGVMDTFLIAIILTGAVLALLNPQHLRLSLAAGLLYPPYYVAVTYAASAIVPGFFAMWDGTELWGLRVFGLPLEEIAFVYVYSAAYPLIIGWAYDARLLVQPDV